MNARQWLCARLVAALFDPSEAEPKLDVVPLPTLADYESPEPDLYEVTWKSGHVERIVAHDMSFSNNRVIFLADVKGRMRVQLSATEEDLRTIRSITEDEVLPLGDGGEPA